MAELDRLDREHGLGAMPVPSHRRAPRTRRRHGPVLPGLLVTGLILSAVVALSPAEDMRAIRRLVGFDNDRLGTAPQVPHGVGSYAFMQTQPGSDEPVAYDPCRVIEVAVNPAGAPDDYDELVDTAIAHTSGATGLKFERVGLTDDRDVVGDGQPLLGRRPVLVAWATDEEVPELAGDVAGIGGSVAVETSPEAALRDRTGHPRRRHLRLLRRRREPRSQAIVDHEFGHLVGLGHVHDPGELMYDDNLGRTTYGPGDREGLARLGSVDC